jgi:hypothetical protein
MATKSIEKSLQKKSVIIRKFETGRFWKKLKWSDLPKIDDDNIFELFTKNLYWEVPAPVQHLIEKLEKPLYNIDIYLRSDYFNNLFFFLLMFHEVILFLMKQKTKSLILDTL